MLQHLETDEGTTEHMGKILGRLYDLICDKTYRKILVARLRIFCARLFLPELSAIGVVKNNQLLFLLARDNAITPASIVSGGFQQETMTKAIEILEQSRPIKRRLFLDIGANIGTSTLQAIQDFGFNRAISFEPVPSNLQILRANVAGLQGRCRIVECGISDSIGTASIALSAENCGDHRIDDKLANVVKTGNCVRSTTEIYLQTLDNYFASNSEDIADIDLIWIDTQGHEERVLKGAQATLVATKSPVIFEVWPWALAKLNNFDSIQSLFPDTIYTAFYDLGAKDAKPLPVANMADYVRNLPKQDYFNTDFLVL